MRGDAGDNDAPRAPRRRRSHRRLQRRGLGRVRFAQSDEGGQAVPVGGRGGEEAVRGGEGETGVQRDRAGRHLHHRGRHRGVRTRRGGRAGVRLRGAVTV